LKLCLAGDWAMKKLLHSSLLTFALIISGQSFARAGELIFGEGDKWVVFQGPILTEEMDGILSQLDDKKPEQILLNSVGGNLSGLLNMCVKKKWRLGFLGTKPAPLRAH